MEKQKQDSEIIIREESGVTVMEIKMSKKLKEEMERLAEETAGTIPYLTKSSC